jgi:hypothetical protein
MHRLRHHDASVLLRRVGVRALLEYLGHPDPAFTFRPDIMCFASRWPAAHRQARSRGAIFRETGDRHREGVALRNLERDRAAQRET